jgi:hypothetical protein
MKEGSRSNLLKAKVEEGNAKEFARNIINLRQETQSDIPATTYLTHGIHNVYPAKFIPQVPRFVINKFNLKGKVILDPFAGSGTTAVESVITGNSNISNDINPITRFLIDVKTIKLNPRDYFSYRDRLSANIKSIFRSKSKFIPNWENINYWYPPDILLALSKVWGGIHNIDENEEHMKSILKVSALYISRKYSYGEDKSPKLFRSKQKTIRVKELTQKFQEQGPELLRNELSRKAKQYLESIMQFNSCLRVKYKKVNSLNFSHQPFLLVLNSSLENLDKILVNGTIDCIITSPPYIYAQEYFRSTKIDMYWLDMVNDETIRKLTKQEIGQKYRPFYDLSEHLLEMESYNNAVETIERLAVNFKTKENVLRFKAYFNDMYHFIHLSNRLLVSKGILSIFIGEPKVFGYNVKVKDIISEILEKCNFRIKYTFFDIIKSRHLSKNRLNENPEGIPGEWLIIGEKL